MRHLLSQIVCAEREADACCGKSVAGKTNGVPAIRLGLDRQMRCLGGSDVRRPKRKTVGTEEFELDGRRRLNCGSERRHDEAHRRFAFAVQPLRKVVRAGQGGHYIQRLVSEESLCGAVARRGIGLRYAAGSEAEIRCARGECIGRNGEGGIAVGVGPDVAVVAGVVVQPAIGTERCLAGDGPGAQGVEFSMAVKMPTLKPTEPPLPSRVAT